MTTTFYLSLPYSLDGFTALLLPSMTTPSPEPASRAGPSPGLATKDSSPENRLGLSVKAQTKSEGYQLTSLSLHLHSRMSSRRSS
jgi:hypothetical protein